MTLMIRIAAALLAAPVAPAAAQQSIEAPGTVAHAAAATGFPERVGEFRRTSVTRFDEAGRDISASYNWYPPGGRVLATVYIYPAPPASPDARAGQCRAHFEQVQQAVTSHAEDARVVERGVAPAMAGAEPGLGHRSVLRFRTMFGSDLQDVHSEARLYCYVGGDWMVKYRATWNASLDIADALDAFVRAGPWPGRHVADPAEVAAASIAGAAMGASH